jgi:alpha-beta hydrolase superfamily lysophospholipase
VIERQQKHGEEVVVCLLGHSMGGILSAEAILKYADMEDPPIKLVGLIAYDTPFFGVHENVRTSGMFVLCVIYSITNSQLHFVIHTIL